MAIDSTLRNADFDQGYKNRSADGRLVMGPATSSGAYGPERNVSSYRVVARGAADDCFSAAD
jgi:hypothetical protein